jgi:hypothetical protein
MLHHETDINELPSTPNGKIFGIVKYRYQLKSVCDALAAVDVREVEIFDGSTGAARLRAWEERFSHFILGERETDLLKGYLEAVESHFIVFTAVVDWGQDVIAADRAKAAGARGMSRFGNSVVTSY